MAYMYEHDPYLEHRYFILNCPEIFQGDHYSETWAWLVDSLAESDRLLKRTAIRGMCRMGDAGRHYLEEFLASPQGKNAEIAELIRQELECEWGPDR